MNDIQLCNQIRKKLEVALKDIYHPTDSSRGREEEYKAPEIMNGYLPPKNSDEIPDFPCVIVRPSEGDTEMLEGSIPSDFCTVKMLIGSYGRENSDFEYCLVIKSRIVNYFRANPSLNGGFKMKPVIKWKMPDEQGTPIWYVQLITMWEMPTVQEILEGDGYV